MVTEEDGRWRMLVHLAAGGPVGIATRNCLLAGHALRRLLWPHTFGTQYSNQIATRTQMVQGGDFACIFSFTHAGMCKLFDPLSNMAPFVSSNRLLKNSIYDAR